jgi:ankyrin repeat protein
MKEISATDRFYRNLRKFNGPWLPKGRLTVASVNCFGNTPLHVAAMSDHVDIVRKLISSGAEVNAKADASYTPLHLVSHVDIARELLAAGAAPRITNDFGATPAEIAHRTQRCEIADLLNGWEAHPATIP